MRSRGLGREDLPKKKKDIIKGKGNLSELPGMGAADVVEKSTVGKAEAGAVGTVEKDAEGVTRMGAMGVAGAGIPTPDAILGLLKVSAIKEIGMQMKCKYKKRKKKKRERAGEERYIPMKSGLGEALSSSLELEILLFRMGTSSGSSRMSLDPSEDKSILGPRVAEPGMEEGVTTREAPPFAAWEIAAKGSLVEITSGKSEGAVLV